VSLLHRAADRLAAGAAAVARHRIARTETWIARGRRHDLTGWRAALGCWVRIGLLAVGLYLLWRLVRAVPTLLWLLAAVWTAAAWRAGKPATVSPAETDDGAPAAPPGEAVRRLLLDVMANADTVHLRTVLAHLQEHGQWEGRTVAQLRVHLERLDVPVDRNVKVAGIPTWGVRRRDLQPPSPDAAQEASTKPSTAA